jgi:hypothetical protein
LDGRHESPLGFVERYLIAAAKFLSDLADTANALEGRLQESLLTPHAHKQTEIARMHAQRVSYDVMQLPDDPLQFQVATFNSAENRIETWRVNIGERTCGCYGRQKYGFACCHEYSVMLDITQDVSRAAERRIPHEVVYAMDMEYVEWCAQPCFNARTFINAVRSAGVRIPQPSSITMDETRLPPGARQGATIRTSERVRGRISSLGPSGPRLITARSRSRASSQRVEN